MVTEQEAALALQTRRRARSKFSEFCLYISPDEPPAYHHRFLCDALDDVVEGRNRRLMVFMPPGSAKSTYSSVKFPAYFLGRFPNKSIICGSYGEGLSTSFGRKVRNIVTSSEYNVLFDTSLSEDSRAKGEWETQHGGSYFACGVGSGVTGRRASLGVIDDPVKGRKEADSELVRDETWEWYRSDFLTRLKPDSSQIIIQCMTGDTLVTMSDGSYKDLKDINVGDEVATYDNGKITTSKVLNWANQGLDSVYKIRTSSGIIVKANERHPFLVSRDGKLEWVRLKNLKVGEHIQRVIGGNTKELHVSKKAVKSLQSVKAIVCRTTTKLVGLLGIGRNLLVKTLHPVSAQSSSIAMALPLMTIKSCCMSKTECAPFVVEQQKTQEILSIGIICSALITAMKQIKSEGFFVITATWLSGKARHLKFLSRQQDTSDFILDKIEAIEFDGVEDVFDIQVERTENFIANGLVSHNTRWHEDDLSGRILPDSWNGESGKFKGFDNQMWTVICLPAEARENDILGREVGEWLWLDYFHKEFWEETKAIQTAKDYRNWNALYQQTPQPDDGVFFKRDWFKRFDLGEEPVLKKYAASDYAVTDGSGDFTEHGIGGFDIERDLYFTDWWSGQTSPDEWIDEQLRMAKNHKPFVWCAEVGVIRRSVEPFLKRRMLDKKVYFRMEWLPHIGDKAANARAFQALASMGKVWIPRCEWGDALLNQLVKFIPNTNFKDDKVDVCGLFGRILDQTFAPKAGKVDDMSSHDKLLAGNIMNVTFDDLKKEHFKKKRQERANRY